MTERKDPWPAGTPCWVDLTASDPGRTREFYHRVLGWEYSDPDPEQGGSSRALVDGRPVAGLFPSVPDLQGVPHLWQVHLASDRIDASAQRVLAAGGRQLVAPVPVGPSGTTGMFADPTGATFGLWQAGEHLGFAVVGEPGAVAWCDLMTPDHDAARDFYAEVFGYSYEDIGRDGTSYALFTVPGGDRPAGGIGGTDSSAGNAPAVWSVCFEVADVDAAVQRVREIGGSVMEDPVEFEHGRLAVVAGPDRESFALLTPTGPA